MRGVVSFVFDDGYQKVFQTVPALLESYNWRGVFAVALQGEKIAATEQRPVQPWQDWLTIAARGHELAAHSVNHVNLTTCSAAELASELHEPAEQLQAKTLVYPGGAYNAAVIDAAKHYYQAGRTVQVGFESLPPRQPLQLKSYNFSRNNFSVWRANLLAAWAWLTNSWLIETYHMVDDNETEMMHSVKTKDLQKHLDFVKRLPISVKTISDVIGNHYH